MCRLTCKYYTVLYESWASANVGIPRRSWNQSSMHTEWQLYNIRQHWIKCKASYSDKGTVFSENLESTLICYTTEHQNLYLFTKSWTHGENFRNLCMKNIHTTICVCIFCMKKLNGGREKLTILKWKGLTEWSIQ